MMYTFFHGWRRKMGCVTLMLACGLMAMWMRSDFLLDRTMFVIAGRQHDVQSLDGKISWSQDKIDAFHEPISNCRVVTCQKVSEPAGSALQRRVNIVWSSPIGG
jgi:hypothetical protein